LYPEIDDSICDCALLPTDYPTQGGELPHTEVLAETPLELSLDGSSAHLALHCEHRLCARCGQHWWLYRRDRVDLTYDRDDETRIVGKVASSDSPAVRADDRAAQQRLDDWVGDYFSALARRDRLNRRDAGRRTVALVDAVRQCIGLADQSRSTAQLAETTARAVKLADPVRRHCNDTLQRTIAALEADPQAVSVWAQLQAAQRTCAEARLDDPARELRDWSWEEWWTPALAGMRRRQTALPALRTAARGSAMGSAAHLALRDAEDAIAAQWRLHLDQVQWPHPDAAFVATLEHALSLEPMVVKGDRASWNHADRIGSALKSLIQQGVTPDRHVEVPGWLAARTGLPDTRKRYEAHAAARYWLDIRRARRKAGSQ